MTHRLHATRPSIILPCLVLLLAFATNLKAEIAPAPGWMELKEEAAGLIKKGKYDAAIKVGSEYVKAVETELGPAHLDTAKAYSTLAFLYHDIGQYDQYESYLKRAIEAYRQNGEKSRLSVASLKVNLANLYWLKGRRDAEVETLYKSALEIFEAEKDRPAEYLLALDCLAEYYRLTGKTRLAKPYKARSRELNKISASEQKDLIETLEALAQSRKKKGQNRAAKEYQDWAKEIRAAQPENKV